MNISLTKLPWYGQVGAFAVLAIGGIGAFIYYYDMPARAEIQTREDQLVMLQKDITRGQNTARKLPEFEKEVSQLEARLTATITVSVLIRSSSLARSIAPPILTGQKSSFQPRVSN